MLARKEHNLEKEGTPVSKEWLEEINLLLHEVYAQKCSDQERTFNVYGFTYDDEMLLIASFQKEKDSEGLPVSIFISADIDRTKRDDKLLKSMVDFLGLALENIFPQLDPKKDREEIYQIRWIEQDFEGRVLHTKVTRENVHLTLQATRLLNQ